MGVTIQLIEKTEHGIRTTSEYDCDSLEDAEGQAVYMTSGDGRDAKGKPYPYDVAIIRRHGIVMARYFHTIQIP